MECRTCREHEKFDRNRIQNEDDQIIRQIFARREILATDVDKIFIEGELGNSNKGKNENTSRNHASNVDKHPNIAHFNL